MQEKSKISKETRQLCYSRDNNGQCQFPGCKLSKSNGDVVNLHHIKNEQFGGGEEPSNLITLCDIHHKAMHIEFSAYYSDSEGVLRKMKYFTLRFISKLRSLAGVDDAFDLRPLLFYLTKSSTFRDGQLQAIRASIKHEDVLLVTPTGTGKSVCYQIPALLADNPSLVISPLKSLMVDQVRSIWSKMIPATYINSDLGSVEKKQRYDFVSKKLYKFIFAAPERFYGSKDPANRQLYTNYAYFIIDEAHAIDSWGIAFRPSYRKLGDLRNDLSRPPVIALTATASKETQRKIIESLNMTDAKVIVTGFYKDNIKIYKFISNQNKINKYVYLKTIVSTESYEKTLIFVPTLKEGERLLVRMSSEGYEVDFYNGKLDSKKKMDIQERFTSQLANRLDTLICTSAFGMGIDIPNIRTVVHWSPALSLTEYTQQIGRAGRDGKQSEAHVLYDPQDEGLLRFMATRATKASNFRETHGYSDDDVTLVNKRLNDEVTEMLGLLYAHPGNEWAYILDYFGETPVRFWAKHGKLIIDSIYISAFIAFVWMAISQIK